MKRLYTERQQSLERRRLEETWRAYRAEKRMDQKANAAPKRMDQNAAPLRTKKINKQRKAPWED